MTRLVFVRHGESLGNLTRTMCGHYDVELTDKGRMQAENAAEFLKDQHFDAAYSSDLKRAYETAECILQHHPGVELHKDPALRETFIGDWEWVPRTEIAEKYPAEFNVWANDIWNAHPVGGESIKDQTKRMYDAAWRIARENEGKTVLIACHGMSIRTLTCGWLGMPYEKMNDTPWVGNASVSMVDYDTENMITRIVVLGDDSFQGDMATTVAPFTEVK